MPSPSPPPSAAMSICTAPDTPLPPRQRHVISVHVGSLSAHYESLSVELYTSTTAAQLVRCACRQLSLPEWRLYQLCVLPAGDGAQGGGARQQHVLEDHQLPVQVLQLQHSDKQQQQQHEQCRLCLCERVTDSLWSEWHETAASDSELLRRCLSQFVAPTCGDREYPDLCQLPQLTEETLLDNLRQRFNNGHIYTYVNSILLAVNPFKFYPIYNPKYVKLYQCRRLDELPPHVFAIADAAYQRVLRSRDCAQCVVISGESGSGKTETTSLLLHHLTALSQKGALASSVEQTLLAAGPVLEAFGNAKTVHNNNSSRFGKFIQVNYKESGQVNGASVEKYLLEKSRIVSQGRNERNYHVFYYLLTADRHQLPDNLHLLEADQYHYLSQSGCSSVGEVDGRHEFARLCRSMQLVGFSHSRLLQVFSLLSAVLLIGNVTYQNKLSHHHDESVSVSDVSLVQRISQLLHVSLPLLTAALTQKRAKASGELVVINYRMAEAVAARDTLAKCVYATLFDWIVRQLNVSLMAGRRQRRSRRSSSSGGSGVTPSSSFSSSGQHRGASIGVLDIFGFEDFGNVNSFEQLCINYANEHLQYYFNVHVFQYEQDEYAREHIAWRNIGFADNTGCLQLFENKRRGLLTLMDDQCSFPGATNETLLEKFHAENRDNPFYELPHKFEPAFLVHHYAGKVKYQVGEFREKNLDLLRPDIVSVLRSSRLQLVRELVSVSCARAVKNWTVLRCTVLASAAFKTGTTSCSPRATLLSRPLSDNTNHNTASENGERRNSGTGVVARGAGVFNVGTRLHDNSTIQKSQSCLTVFGGGGSVNGDDSTVSGRESSVTTASSAAVSSGAHVWQRHRSLRSHKQRHQQQQQTGVVTAAPRSRGAGTVAAQFQSSLQSLLVTLNQANPFFIRCIKSNSLKEPDNFDDVTVSRQLRYTGMLETVRIRQCGYNIRLTYTEFSQMYSILLPSLSRVSSSEDQGVIAGYLDSVGFPVGSYQLGLTKVFLRESGKLQLDYQLHVAILARIVRIQRWYRVCVHRRRFLMLRSAAVKIQAHVRSLLAQRVLQNMRVRHLAATFIQKVWRGYTVRRWYQQLRAIITRIQARMRGNLARVRFRNTLLQRVHSQQQQQQQQQHNTAHTQWSDETGTRQDIDTASSVVVNDTDSDNTATLTATHVQSSPLNNDLQCDSEDVVRSLDHASVSVSSLLSDNEMPVVLDSRDNVRRRPLRRGRPRAGDVDGVTSSCDVTQRARDSSPPQPPPRVRVSHSSNSVDESRYRLRDSLDMGNTTSLTSFSAAAAPSAVSKPGATTVQSLDDSSLGRRRQPGHRRHPSRQLVRRLSADSVVPAAGGAAAGGASGGGAVATFTHRLQRSSKAPRGELCFFCHKPITALFVQGFHCVYCRHYFHSKCVPAAADQSCRRVSSKSVVLRSSRAATTTPVTDESCQRHSASGGREWSLHGTSEFTDREYHVITDAAELKQLEHFIAAKIYEQEHGGDRSSKRESSSVDRVFVDALKHFKLNLLTIHSSTVSSPCQPSSSHQQQQPHDEQEQQQQQQQHDIPSPLLNLGYRDLIDSFTTMLSGVMQQRNSEFPLTMGVNAFRGYLNTFIQKVEETPQTKKHKRRRPKKKKKGKKEDATINRLGHCFQSVLINIPTVCEVCSSFLWLMEKGFVCQNCKLTCHKKCQQKVLIGCSKADPSFNLSAGGAVLPFSMQPSSSCSLSGRVFGASLSRLVAASCSTTATTPDSTDDEDGCRVPPVIDRLLVTIELRALHVEGLYRKSGVSRLVTQLRQQLELKLDQVDLDDVSAHVMTACVKAWLRELPEPLLTFSLYGDLVRATRMLTSADRTAAIFELLDQLPPSHLCVLERVLFHLARVVMHQHENKMSPHSLAIVFAPCILRTDRPAPAQDTLRDISVQTECVETMIDERVCRLRATLASIDQLDEQSRALSSQLTQHEPPPPPHLVDSLRRLLAEKRKLTSLLPRLNTASGAGGLSASDDETLLDSPVWPPAAGSLACCHFTDPADL